MCYVHNMSQYKSTCTQTILTIISFIIYGGFGHLCKTMCYLCQIIYMETSEAMYNSLRTTLDRDFQLHGGGIEDVLLTNILTNENNDDHQLHRQPTIISQSSFYDVKILFLY